jgi:uncharacterized protein
MPFTNLVRRSVAPSGLLLRSCYRGFASLRFRSAPLRRTRFITQSSLSGLAFQLRKLGLDVLIEDPVGVAEAEKESRILLTRDPALTGSGFSRICVVRRTEVREQLKEVLARLGLE